MESRSRKLHYLLFICIAAFAGLCFILSLFNLLAIPYLRRCSFLSLIIVLLAVMLLDIKKNIKPALMAVSIVACLYFINAALDPRERRSEYNSPNRSKTIIIEYDHASRPSVYRRLNLFFMIPIKFDFGPGYNETVTHKIIWLSEDSFKLVDYDGSEWLVDFEGRK